MYQYSGYHRKGNSHTVMSLSIDSVVQKHTVSLTGDTYYVGNFGLWQGSLAVVYTRLLWITVLQQAQLTLSHQN